MTHVGLSLLTLNEGQGTGTRAYVHGLLRELGRCDYPERVTALLRERDLGDFASFGGGRVDLAAVPSTSPGQQGARLSALSPPRMRSRRMRRLLAGIDVLHYPLTIPAPRVRLPYVLTLHDVQHHDLPQLFSKAQRAWRRTAYDQAARGAAVVITDSRHAKSRIVQRIGIDPDRIEVAHLGIDTDRFTPESGDTDEGLLAPYSLPERFLLYPAALWPHKNHVRLLDALAALDDPSLHLVLTGPEAGRRRWFLEAVRERRLEQRVRHLGLVAPNILPPLYRRAQALVFPSLYEGFGAPPLEAMACGCPVACSAAASLPEICGGAAIMFEPASSASMVEAVQRILSEPQVRERLRSEGLARVGAFTWQRAAERHRAAYRLAVSDPAS